MPDLGLLNCCQLGRTCRLGGHMRCVCLNACTYEIVVPLFSFLGRSGRRERRGRRSTARCGLTIRSRPYQTASHVSCFLFLSLQVLEETGLEIDSMVRPDDMIEATSDNKLCQLFIVCGLDPEAAKFAPQVQKVSSRSWRSGSGELCRCSLCAGPGGSWSLRPAKVAP